MDDDHAYTPEDFLRELGLMRMSPNEFARIGSVGRRTVYAFLNGRRVARATPGRIREAVREVRTGLSAQLNRIA